jgi:septal ring factor EnvC (AmiA/AmiB activator)
MDGSDSRIAVELAQLRGDMTTAMARIEGQLNLLVQSNNNVRADVEDLEKRVASLEARRLPTGLVAGMSGAVSAVVAVAAVLVR